MKTRPLTEGEQAALNGYAEALRATNIIIAWGNRETYNRHQVALDVQDAVNLRALAREFVKVVDTAMEATNDTGKTWEDAAVVLFVNKFESLCRSDARFSDAYAVCKEKAVANG